MPALRDAVDAALLGVVEGATEYLPVSSTGHLILAGRLLGRDGEAWASLLIFIQLGAVLAVGVEWREKLLARGELRRLAPLLALGFAPAAALGLAAGKAIKAVLFEPAVVAAALLAGAAWILLADRRHGAAGAGRNERVGPGTALGIGLFQCLALVPGTSRSLATILGGMHLGLSRSAATEFSFLLALPTLAAAALYDLWKSRAALGWSEVPAFAVGFAVSFVVALLVVRWLVRWVRGHDFRAFAAWRAAVGVAVLLFGS